MNAPTPDEFSETERRRRIRRNVWLLALVAIAFYAGFIFLNLSRNQP